MRTLAGLGVVGLVWLGLISSQLACGTRGQPGRAGTASAMEARGPAGPADPSATDAGAPADARPAENAALAPPRFNPLGVGAVHACFRRADGIVLCWGENTFGMLGDGTETARYAPVEVRGLSGAVDLVVEANGSCARTEGGDVLCWGRFGPGLASYLVPHAIRGLEGTVQLAITAKRICGLRPNGTVLCRDRASDLEAGEATPVAGVSEAVELIADGSGLCVRRTDGTVLCGGGDAGAAPEAPAVVPGVDDAETIWYAWGAYWVRRSTGQVWTWGHDVTRAISDEAARTAVPHPAADSSGVLAQATSLQARCALTRDGAVHCRRQLSDEEYTLGADFERVDFPSPVVALAASATNVCGVDEAGEVRCFGDNSYGQLGRGDARDAVSRPTAVPGIDDAEELVTGEWNACARRASGKVDCWSMPFGESPAPGPQAVPGISHASSLYTGGQYTCAADRRGAMHCWGLATWLPCRWESEDNCRSEPWDEPRTVPGLAGIEGAREVVGDCVRMPEGRVRCAQRYEGGPVVDIAGVEDATRLAGGAWLRCILRGSGRVACLWPEYRGLEPPVPADLPDIADATALAAGSSHLCVVHRSGTVSCSEIMQPSTACPSSSDPCASLRPVEGLVDAVDVVAGRGFSCVLHRDGGVSCWGTGGQGVLGDGTTQDRAQPVRVPDIADGVELDASEDHVCVRRSGGQVLCWGRILPGTAADERPSAPVRLPGTAAGSSAQERS